MIAEHLKMAIELWSALGHQYEQAGSIAAFLPRYLQQIVTVGYNNAPFEIDARSHELGHA